MRASRIRELRDRLGLTQTEMGYVIGAHWVTVSNWERGKKKPSGAYAQVLSALWNVCTWEPERIARFVGADSLQTWVERALREAT